MKYSRQREIILNLLEENKIHPTADTVYSILKNKGEKVSLATVYRNLNNLANSGEIKRFKTSEKTERFDSTTMPHYHFLCKHCGIVYDLPIEIAEDVSKNANKLGFKVTEYDMMLGGICPECQKKEKKYGT